MTHDDYIKRRDEALDALTENSILYGRGKLESLDVVQIAIAEAIDQLVLDSKLALLSEMAQEANDVPPETFYRKELDYSNIKAFVFMFHDRLSAQRQIVRGEDA